MVALKKELGIGACVRPRRGLHAMCIGMESKDEHVA